MTDTYDEFIKNDDEIFLIDKNLQKQKMLCSCAR